MPTYTLNAGRPDDGTFEVGTGPFPDLPAGDFSGNFYGNDPRLGRIQAGDQRYSLLSNQEADVASSGNTFQVGTGPQPGLPSGVFRPGEIQSFLRNEQRAAAAAAAAAQAPPPPVSPTPTAGSEIPAQDTLPNPTTPVAVPSFVPSTGLPNFGSSNLLSQTSVPGTTGGFPNVPNIVSPLEPLLATPSTLPATGTSVPNIGSNIGSNLGSQSVFTQLFPSVPDISQQPIATAAHGGPILASDSLPRYQEGGGVNFGDTDVSDPNHGVNPRSPFRRFQGTNVGTDPYYADEGELEIFLNQGFTLQDIFGPGYTDRLNRYTGRTITPSGIIRRDPNIDSLDPDQAELQLMADGGPILASEYLNAGGPARYFENGGAVGAGLRPSAPPGDDTSDTPDPDNPGQVAAGLDTGEGLLFEGRPVTAAQSRELTARQFDQLTDFQIAQVSKDVAEGRATLQPEVPAKSTAFADAQNAINPKGFPGLGKAITQSLLANRPLGLEGKLASLPPATIALLPPETPPTGLSGFFSSFFNAEGGPIMASERLNAGGPVQYFSNGGADGLIDETDPNQTDPGTTSTTTQMTDEEVDAHFANVPFGMFTNPANEPHGMFGTGKGVSGASLGLTEDQVTDLVTSEDINNPNAMIGYSDPVINVLTDPIPIPFTNRTLPFNLVDVARTGVTAAIPPLGLMSIAQQAAATLQALNQGQTPPGVAGFATNVVTELGINLPDLLQGSMTIVPENPNDLTPTGSLIPETQ